MNLSGHIGVDRLLIVYTVLGKVYGFFRLEDPYNFSGETSLLLC